MVTKTAVMVVMAEAPAEVMAEVATAMVTEVTAMVPAVMAPVTAAVLDLRGGRVDGAGDFRGHRHRCSLSAARRTEDHRAH